MSAVDVLAWIVIGYGFVSWAVDHYLDWKYDWNSPRTWVNLIGSCFVLALAIVVVAS